jgi:superfamily II DNA or RNA helicase
LVIAATGTGKTVIAAFDFKRIYEQQNKQVKLLFVAHRQTILEQALTTFRNVLRDQNFGELLVGNHQASRREQLFCSISMLSRRRLWEQVDSHFYDFIIIDEAHHGTADSYRPLFVHFQPQILLGLTATPERMDGGNVAADFGNRFAAEIRLPEALEEKLLCPFHYFGVSDPVSLKQDKFWRNGKYDASELEKIYTGAHALAKQRLAVILDALHRYEPDMTSVKGLGFCLTIKHAKFMAEMFNQRGIPSGAIVSGLDDQQCQDLMGRFTAGELNFLFTVDKLSEGLDVPEVNVVLFLRPTESLTVFLQQLGRGLRHAPGKDCLTVLDFVGQAHRKYRLDSKLKAILPRHRFGIDKEVEYDFPHLPAGCSIQLDRLSKGYVLDNIRENLSRLAVQVPERIQTFSNETGLELTFGNFINYHDYEPELLLKSNTWSSWKAKAQHGPVPLDPDLGRLGKTLIKASFINGPKELMRMRQVVGYLADKGNSDGLRMADSAAMAMYYRIWGDTAENIGVASLDESFQRLSRNPSIIADLDEILAWSEDTTQVSGIVPELPFPCLLELHAKYGGTDILANLGRANLQTAGQRGVGVLHFSDIKAYVLLVTFQKTEQQEN